MTEEERKEAFKALGIEAASRQKCMRLNAIKKKYGGGDWEGCFCDKEDRLLFLKSFKKWLSKKIVAIPLSNN